MISAATLLVRRLAQLGVAHVFGYPGGQLTPLYDALLDAPAVRHVLSRHEQASAFMADGYSRSTGRPGVCLAVCGPGVYNAATPLATAHTDSVPVLLISGQVPLRGAGLRSGFYHENDQAAACAHFTKAVFRVTDPDRVVSSLDRAWAALTQGRPGPVLLEVPVDVLRAGVGDGLPPLPGPAPLQGPSRGDVEKAVAQISRWRRPLVLAGGGVIASGAEQALLSLAGRLGAPVHHTGNGKCAVPASSPLNAGLTWSAATSDLSEMAPYLSPLFDQADGLLAVGCRFTQLTTGSWLLRLPPSLVHIDIDPGELGRHYQPAVGIISDAREALEQIAAGLPGPPRQPWVALPAPSQPWQFARVDAVGALRRALPPDTIVCADVTRLAYMIMARLPLEGRRSFLHPAGSVAMGYALPAALGARAAHPTRPIVAVVGDGGFQMSALELASAAQENMPVVVLLVNDSCLTLIKATQDRHYPGRHTAVALKNPDFGKLAGAFGVPCWPCQDAPSLERSLREALAHGGPALVELNVGE